MSASPFAELPHGQAGAILADPPWQFKNWGAPGAKSADAHYQCQDLDWIKALPVRGLANPAGCVLIMWATAPMIDQAFDVMRAWGFRYSSFGTWAKQSKTGKKWAFGTGRVYRNAAEFWLFGSIGKPKAQVKNVRNLIVAPVREHSRKPDQMHTDIERQWPGPYVELFARTSRPGWDVWGNETEKYPAAA